MKREKNIEIPVTLFILISKYFLLDSKNFETENLIKKGIEARVNAYNKREFFSKIVTAKTPEEKEKARQEYLDAAGIPDSFRWPEGYDNAR